MGDVDVSKCTAVGVGLNQDSIATKEVTFTIEVKNSSGQRVTGFDVNKIKVEIVRLHGLIKHHISDNKDGTFTVRYIPDIPGMYRIDILINNHHITGSPFQKKVSLSAIESQKYRVKCYVSIGYASEKAVDQANTEVNIKVTGPTGNDVNAQIQYVGNGNYSVIYEPTDVGDYVVDAYVNQKQVEGCPYLVYYGGKKESSPSHTIAYGRGVEGPLVRGKKTQFTIESRDSSNASKTVCGEDFQVDIINDQTGRKTPSMIIDNEDGSYFVEYTPSSHGPHTLNIKLRDTPIAKSPYKVDVKKPNYKVQLKDPKKTPFEPGQLIEHYVHAEDDNGEPVRVSVNDLDLSIKGPRVADAYIDPVKETGSIIVAFEPAEKGSYSINLLLRDEPILPKPIVLQVGEAEEAVVAAPEPVEDIQIRDKELEELESAIASNWNVVASGPGLTAGQVAVPAHFQVRITDVKTKKTVPLDHSDETTDIIIFDKKGKYQLSPTIKPVPGDPGLYTVEYVPEFDGPHQITIMVQGNSVLQHHPVIIPPAFANSKSSAGRTLAYGPGVEHASANAGPVHFTVEVRTENDQPSDEPTDQLSVKISGPPSHGLEPIQITPSIKKLGGGKFEVTYDPEGLAGDYEVDVQLNAQEIHESPFTAVMTGPVFKASFSEVNDPKLHVPEKFSFTVEPHAIIAVEEQTKIQTSKIDLPKPSVTIQGPNGPLTATLLPAGKEGKYQVEYTATSLGPHQIDVKLNKRSALQTTVNAHSATVAGNSVAYGPAIASSHLTRGIPTSFTVELRDSKERRVPYLGDTIKASMTDSSGKPLQTPINIKHNNDGTYSVELTPQTVGEHQKLLVLVNDEHIKDSPFNKGVVENADVDASKSIAYGDGLKSSFVGKSSTFFVEPRDSHGNKIGKRRLL